MEGGRGEVPQLLVALVALSAGCLCRCLGWLQERKAVSALLGMLEELRGNLLCCEPAVVIDRVLDRSGLYDKWR